ncbi:MAG: phospholipase D-like domain-containing protein [Candidatus Omnitrophica bacterium]|nr:phospholipase D-like domain-containing protein [Candidatus Omnitrophota bacterium]
MKGITALILLLQYFSLAAEISVFFSPSDKIDRIIIKKLQQAKRSVYIASYTFNWKQGYDILEKLSKSGKDVKILLNFLPYQNFNVTENLQVKKWGKKSCALHSKFMVIDEKYVFVGSANFTESSMKWDSNNILLINDQTTARFFAENFLSLWSNSIISKGQLLINDSIEIYFSPVSDCVSIVKNEIKKAKESLKFVMFTFTSDEIGGEICRSGIKGIKVYGIFEGSQNPFSNEYNVMKKIDLLKVKKDCFVNIIHDKFLIIDQDTAITGSFNYTEAAKKNIETLIVIKRQDIVSRFLKRWRFLWLWY